MPETLDENLYKQEQEAFVSNNNGTSAQEVFLSVLPNIASIFFLSTTLFHFQNFINNNLRVLLEFSIVILTCAFSVTILSNHPLLVTCILVFTSVIQIFFFAIRTKPLKICPPLQNANGIIQFVTNFRAVTNLVTAACILAVDFPAFPRKFSKTETSGYSLMDTGVGLFIVANAIVSPEARNISKDRYMNFLAVLRKNLKNCGPLLVLGFGRFFMIEFLGYQKHVSEYGIHWNFFFTLAFVKLFTGFVSRTFFVRFSLVSGLWLLAMHEYTLTSKDLKNWVLGPTARDDFVSANREGLISLPGYVGLYFVSVTIGRLIHSAYSYPKKHWKLDVRVLGLNLNMEYTLPMTLCVKLSIVAAQSCILNLFSDFYFGVSRRLMNFAYCSWILTLASTLLTILLLIDIIIDILGHLQREKSQVAKKKGENLTFGVSPEIFQAMNYNGLLFFLLANVLTGSVNLGMKTLYVDDLSAVIVLIVYMGINVFGVLYLYRNQIRLRL